jgi:hypothetical protein
MLFEPHVQVNSNIFANFTGGNNLASQYEQSWQFQIKSVHELTISDFQNLYEQPNRILDSEE